MAFLDRSGMSPSRGLGLNGTRIERLHYRNGTFSRMGFL
jgi:hypothetical protein